MSLIKALFINMGKVVPYFKMTPELANKLHSNLGKLMLYVKSSGTKLTKKQQDYIMDQTKQLDLYEKSMTPPTPKGPKAEVIDLSKKLPEDAPYSEKNPTGWMEGLESLKYKVDDLAEQGKKYKETTVGDFIDDYFGMGKKVETEAEMIARMKKQNKDAVKRLKEKKKTKTAEEIIDEGDFDPSGMKDGGRIGYAVGRGLKLLGLLKKEGTTLKKQIKETMDDFFQRSGDAKYDADALTDSFFEKLDIDIDSVDIKDKLDVYDKFYKELTARPKPSMYEQAAKRDLDEMGLSNEAIYSKYQDQISEDLLKKIVIDDNPQRRAEVMATLDETLTMMDKGMSQGEILNVLKNMKRTKNASGGLNYLMGL